MKVTNRAANKAALPRIVCISHRKDVDGIATAAIVKRATGAETILADYEDIIDKLKSVDNVKELYICDLGLNARIMDSFFGELKRIGTKAKLHYIDHHPLQRKTMERFLELNVDVAHSLEECASVQAYVKFRKSLPSGIKLAAACGAVTDYLDDSPIAKSLISSYERQYVLLEASLLGYGLAERSKDDNFRQGLVEELSREVIPHNIPGVVEGALAQVRRITELMQEIGRSGKKMKLLAFAEARGTPTGTIANLVIGVFDVPVVVGYKFNEDRSSCEISLRGRYDSDHDLGQIVSRNIGALDGAGGGHKKAAGALIPAKNMDRFLRMLDEKLARSG